MKTNIAYQAVIGICLTAATVLADQTIIVPGQFALAEAGSSDNAPLGASEQHFQQVFSSQPSTNEIRDRRVSVLRLFLAA